ncbi:LCP family protein [Saccharibacillus sp. CPCC 101409]|uniref:LCP family glycopolymer transferase n=1 Tax=Saccharibacillus sp. CPCC 101409 TaxID=3058041 RepID=UPI0026730441|nr:LCP family protein [Saccharibacillus sp. CPCC 101409]MDO3411681.1 LCP family protein [Saccharibacillus sp. CPCC 101409]
MKRGAKIVISAVAALTVGVGGYAYSLYRPVVDTMESIYEPLASETTIGSAGPDVEGGSLTASLGVSGAREAAQELPADLSENKPFNLLVLGVDERENDIGRSDAIMLLAVNPQKHSVLMFNIPRDTRTEIVGKGKTDKINHAYAFGGVDMSVDTVENFLDVPVDYYVKVNMEGLERIIDILGGVTVDNPFQFDFEHIAYDKGPIELNGHEALMYSRMRYDDPKGDIGRNERQQLVLSALIDKGKSVSNITKLNSILGAVKDNVKTNLTKDDMLDIVTKYRTQIETVDKDEVQGSGKRIDGIYYYMVDDAEKERIHAELTRQLQSGE